MTPRLYWDQPLLFSFEATVKAHGKLGDRPALELSETAFYPEAGGQLSDRGRLTWAGGTLEVVDAQDQDGIVLHGVSLPEGAALPEVGARVSVSIDEARRRDHMSQHTGQHMLSRAILDVAGAETLSSRLGETICTIDTPMAAVNEQTVAEAEARVARAVLEDHPVKLHYPSPEELARLPLRREPKVTSGVRVVEIEGFDFSPCGGTHCQRTGQVGMVHVVSIERYKGGLRLSFHAGMRALRDYAEKDRLLAAAGRELSCGPEGLLPAVQKARADLSERTREAGALRERLAALEAPRLLSTAPRARGVAFASAVLAGESVEYLRALAGELTRSPDAVAAVASRTPEGVRLLLQRGEGAKAFDAGAAFRRIAANLGGKGGGRPDRAEGVLPAGADAERALAEEWQRFAAGD